MTIEELKPISTTEVLNRKYGVKWKYNKNAYCWESELGVVRSCVLLGGFTGDDCGGSQLWFYPKNGKPELIG